ncbi:hypothetical protein GCM10027277_31020 [Pseudoduganella ginsengisoli]|uniref:Serine hydrolase n=1 Tax=Pseudoduganella ginsengisoli TaxID=1462440 RepID=A0A6L6PY26_9BURK|nr:serine hydrolase [Pseudoduganella ginsengisoli]MTW02513.1 serine hydrolase [Pseudoduganella ginsengisoli]
MKLTTACLSTLALLHATVAFADAPPLQEQIDAALAPMFKADAPGATVIVTRDGQPVFRKAYGRADVDKKTPMQPDMQLRLGSVTKQFTAVAILMLAEQGKLSLQDDITRFLPDYPVNGHRITIEQLLQHKAGIRNYTAMPRFWPNADKDTGVAQFIDFFKNEPLDFAPGERWSYSNSGYFLLGAIIEKASGQRYADFIAQHIFEPLGMQDTAYEGHERSGKHRVEGYRAGFFSGYSTAEKISMTLPYAAGALVSTVDDLARWNDAIVSGKLLKAESWQQAMTPCTLPKEAKCNYGYGWFISSLRGHKMIWHGGDIPGFNAETLRLPDDKLFVAVLSNGNRDVLDSDRIAFTAAAIAIGNPFPEQKAVALAPEALDALAGTYKMPDNALRTFTRKGAGLSYERPGRPAMTLKPYAPDRFFVEGSLTTFEFQRGTDGKVTGVTLVQAGSEQAAVRVAN